ncbi:MAG: alpha/beta fold hydrolase [Pseudomonadota bacterium]
MRRWQIVGLLIGQLLGTSSFAQDESPFDPTGYWTGAISQDGSVLRVEMQIDRSEHGYGATTTFPDWLYYFPSKPETVRVTGAGLVIEDLLSGDAVLELEPRFEQLIGTVGTNGRRIHLKRSLAPPRPLITARETTFVSADGTRLAGTLTVPEFGKAFAGIVMVRGRGCTSRVNGKARVFARYGLAVLTYDKRGSGQSEGDCATFTFDQLTQDAIAALEHLADQEGVDPKRVGMMGESAGAWTIQAATERQRQESAATQPAFLVTWIGPTTSIIQQQLSSAATYGASVGLSEERQAMLAKVSSIIVDRSLSDKEAFAKLDRIRRAAEKEGWLDTGFGGDDIPATRADMPRLWLRRFTYDPSAFLSSVGDLPYLAVFGEKDPIVPVEENVAALRNRGSDTQIVVLKESGHGYDFDEMALTLPSGEAFLKFEGPDTGFTTSTLAFLRQRGFATR